MKKRLYTSLVCGAMLLGVGLTPVVSHFVNNDTNIVYALDNFGNSSDNGNSNSNSNSNSNNGATTGSAETNSGTTGDVNTHVERQGSDVSDTLKGFKPVTKEDMAKARQSSSWLTDIIGYAISILVILTFLGIGLITALDVLYMAFPPVRSFLYTAGTDGAGGMSGMNMSGNSSIGGRQWVSDEAVQVASMLGGSAQATGHAPGMGMGMPMGMMEMPGAQSPQKQQGGGRVAIGVYLQKRVVFLFFLGLASVLLFTSAFTDFGINVGGMVLELLSMLVEKMSNIHFG